MARTETTNQEAQMDSRINTMVARIINASDRFASNQVWAEAAEEGIGQQVWAAYDAATRKPAEMVAFAVVDGFLDV